MSALVPLLLAVPLLGAALLAVLNRLLSGVGVAVVGVGTAVATTAMALAVMAHTAGAGDIVYWFGGWTPRDGMALGVVFVADPAASACLAMGGLLATASLLYAAFYFGELSRLFATLVLVFLAAMAGYCLSGDLFTLFVFFELMATAAYALTAYKIEAPSLAGGFAFCVVNSLGAFLLLWGIALLYGRLGALNLAELGVALQGAQGLPGAYVGVCLALVSCGFLVKAAVVPFHFWHADADAVAPTPVCLLISGIMAELGLFGLARVYFTVFAPALGASAIGPWHILLGFGVATVLVGGVMCLVQRHAKRLLAFSTISHVGIMLCGVALYALGQPGEAIGGAGLYLLAHGPAKGALFLGTGIVLDRLGSVDEAELFGRGRELYLTTALFLLGGLALLGVPPFGTFAGRAMMDAAAAAQYPWLHWVVVAGEATTGAAVLRFGCRTFRGWGDAPAQEGPDCAPEQKDDQGADQGLPRVMLGVAWGLLGVSAVLGAWPGLPDLAVAAGRHFADGSGFAGAVLHGAASAPLRVVAGATPVPGWEVLESPAVAAVLVLLALFGQRMGRTGRAAAGLWQVAPGRVVAMLKQVHHGFIGDYVTWLVVGGAVLTAGFAMALR